jgi:hypothetical protein
MISLSAVMKRPGHRRSAGRPVPGRALQVPESAALIRGNRRRQHHPAIPSRDFIPGQPEAVAPALFGLSVSLQTGDYIYWPLPQELSTS